VVGKHKNLLIEDRKTHPIPFIKSCHELPCISDECEMLVCKETENQEVGKRHKKETT
jgi:hypothetical protein